MGAIFPAERDGLAGDGEQACVIDSGAGDIGAQVFKGGSTGASWLDVHTPLLAPDLRIHLPIVLLEQPVEVLSEGTLQMRQIDQEPVTADPDIVAGGIEPGARNQTVNMGMELQTLVPGMEHGSKAAGGGAQTLIPGEFFRQGGCHGGEEQVESFFSKGAKETTAQLGGKGEGDQEVGSVNQFMEFACHPAARGQGATLGAGFMIAGVIGEVNLMAGVTNKGAPPQSRGAAMSDGPDGAALLRPERRLGGLELRQKSAQRPDDGGALGHEGWQEAVLAWQTLAKLIDQSQGVLAGLVSQMQVNHGAGDLRMTEQLLDRMQMRPRFQQVRGKTVSQRLPTLPISFPHKRSITGTIHFVELRSNWCVPCEELETRSSS